MNKDYMEKVANSIIDQLEQGTAPWLKPWEPGQLRLPFNPTTGKEYRGMNSLWLHMQNKEDPRWLTFNQGKSEGANVRKGEKGTHIVYWKFSEERTQKDEQGRPVIDAETGKEKKINVKLERPRSFTAVVFNASQFDGLPPLEARPKRDEPERNALAEKIIENSGAKISHVDGDRAFYSPSKDSITLPARNQFPTSDNYYATALHELGHWTGHESRLDRDLSHPFGSEGYAREELRAEIASLMLGERMDIGHDPGQHAAYVGSWVKALKEDPREIFRAAADAERIAGFVMGFENEQSQNVEAEQEQPRWTVTQRDSTKSNVETVVLGNTNSPTEALELFRSTHDTSITDNTTGERAGRSEWVRDGSTPNWIPSSDLVARAAVEEMGAELAPKPAAMSQPDYELAEALMLARHYPEPAEFGQTLLNRDVQKAAAVAFGDPTPGIRGQIPDDWTGEVRARPVVVTGDFDEGTLDDRDPEPGEEPQEWRIEAKNSNQRWEWIANGFSAEQAAETTDRLNAVGTVSQPVAMKEQTEQALPDTDPVGRIQPENEADAVQHHSPENPMPNRTYLAVPYKEKEEAKAAAKDAGFKLQWDKDAKSWFAPAGADLKAMQKWNPDSARVITETAPDSPQVQLADALRDAGLELNRGQWLDGNRIGGDTPIMDGSLYRVPVKGDREGQRSGAYAAHLEGQVPGGYIENFKTGERINWKADGPVEQLTPEDRARLAKEAQERQSLRDDATQRRYESTADAAATLWAESPAATAENAYCKAKGIKNPNGLRVVPDAVSPEAAAKGILIAKTAKAAKELRDKNPDARVFKAGDLLIPGRDVEGKMWTLQSVNPYFKSLMKGGRKHGLFSVAGADADGKPIDGILKSANKSLVLAEGYATADTVARLTGQPVIVAFDSGNLNAVAGAMRERFPKAAMVIAADNDHDAPKRVMPNGKPGVNVGLSKAKEAAERNGAGVATPKFSVGDKGSDWNDVEKSRGENDARTMLAEQMAIAKRDAAVNAERMTTLARERDMEARNDPTTSADDANIATERSKAASLISSASNQKTEVNNTAANALATGAKAPSASAAKAVTDRQTGAMRDTVKQERQDVQNDAEKDDKTPKKSATPRPRRRGYDAGM